MVVTFHIPKAPVAFSVTDRALYAVNLHFPDDLWLRYLSREVSGRTEKLSPGENVSIDLGSGDWLFWVAYAEGMGGSDMETLWARWQEGCSIEDLLRLPETHSQGEPLFVQIR